MDQDALLVAIVDGYLFMVIVMWIIDYKMFDSESGALKPNFGPHEGICLFRILLEAFVAPILMLVFILCYLLRTCHVIPPALMSENEEET